MSRPGCLDIDFTKPEDSNDSNISNCPESDKESFRSEQETFDSDSNIVADGIDEDYVDLAGEIENN
jgi:hypothetical protein